MLLSVDLSILEDTDLTLSTYWAPFWGMRTAIKICKECAAIEICAAHHNLKVKNSL